MKRFLMLISLLLICCSEEEGCRDFPEFKISDAYEITDSSAKVDFEIFKPNCESIYFEVSQGIVYNYDPNRLTPETAYDIENFNSSFTEEIRGQSNKKIYYRAYYRDKLETYYSDTKSFTTSIGLPSINISSSPFIIGSTYIGIDVSKPNENGGNTLTMGLCWSINNTPTIEDNVKEINPNVYNNTNTLSYVLNDLEKNTTYKLRAYVENESGISYSDEVIFETKFYNKEKLLNKFVIENSTFLIEDKNEQEDNSIGFNLNSVSYTTDKFSNPEEALSLNGIDSYVGFYEFEYYGRLSISLNFKIDNSSSGNGVIIYLGRDIDNISTFIGMPSYYNYNRHLVLEMVNGKLRLDINYAKRSGSNVTYPNYNREFVSVNELEKGVWHNVILTYGYEGSVGVTNLFLNGEKLGYIQMSNQFYFLPGQTNHIGVNENSQNSSSNSNKYFKGAIDDIIFWTEGSIPEKHIPIISNQGY